MATVRRCIDCDAVLVDEVSSDDHGEAVASASTPLGAGDQIGYELEGWGNQLKVTLEGMLAKAGIGRVWEAGALVVAATDEDAVDDLIATLEGGELPELDDDIPRVALEIEGMDADDHAELDARLLAGAVPHAWDAEDGALIVAEVDEARVLAIVEEVLDGASDDGDGLLAQEALTALYVAVDRLVKNPHDRKLATAYRRAAAELPGLAVPYGFVAADWEDLIEAVRSLADDVAPHADPDPGAGASTETDEDDGDEDPDGEDPDDEVDEVDADLDEEDDDDEDEGLTAVESARRSARELRARLTDLV